MKRDAIIYCLVQIAGFIALFWFCISVAGCKTQIVTVPEIHKEYVHDTINRVDSIYQSHTVIVKGDCEETHDTVLKWKFKEKIVESIKLDSVPYPVEVQVPVRYRSSYDNFCSTFFWIVIIILALWLGWKICDRIPATKPYTTAVKGFFKIFKLF